MFDAGCGAKWSVRFKFCWLPSAGGQCRRAAEQLRSILQFIPYCLSRFAVTHELLTDGELMFFLKKTTLLAAVLLLMLTACGDSNNNNGVDSKCTIGTSKIGDCKL